MTAEQTRAEWNAALPLTLNDRSTRSNTRRRRQPRETSALVAMVRRVVRSLGDRVAQEDPEQLLQLVELQADLQTAIYRAVAGQRAAGITWEAIGSATGTTRQAALMKWGPKL